MQKIRAGEECIFILKNSMKIEFIMQIQKERIIEMF